MKVIVKDFNAGDKDLSRTLKFLNLAGIAGTLLNFIQSFDNEYLCVYVLYVLNGVSIIDDNQDVVYLGAIPDIAEESIFFKFSLEKQSEIFNEVLRLRKASLQNFTIDINSTFKLDPLSPVSWINEAIKQQPTMMTAFRVMYPDMPYQDLVGLVNVLMVEGYVSVPDDFKKRLLEINGGK